MWRTLDGGVTWSAVRGAPGGDDYQRIWINPNDPNIIFAVADQGAVVSANRGRELEQLVQPEHRRDVSRHHRQRVSVSRLFGPAGFGQRVRAEPIGRWADHVSRLASGEHPGIRDGRAGPEESGHRLRQPAQRRVPLRSADRADARRSGPTRSGTLPGGGAMNRNVRTMPLVFSPVDELTMYYASERGVEEHRPRPFVDAHLRRPHARRRGRFPPTPASTARR